MAAVTTFSDSKVRQADKYKYTFEVKNYNVYNQDVKKKNTQRTLSTIIWDRQRVGG